MLKKKLVKEMMSEETLLKSLKKTLNIDTFNVPTRNAAHLFVSRVSTGYHIYNRSSIPEGIHTTKAGSTTGTMAEESIEACNVG
jgi:hypothetical protein